MLISNWETHGVTYLTKCKELNITPNQHALPTTKANDAQGPTPETQETLDGFVSSSARWSTRWAARTYSQLCGRGRSGTYFRCIISIPCVLTYSQSFRVVDTRSFRGLLKYQRPATKEDDIPHRQKVRDEVIEKAKVVIERMKRAFQGEYRIKCRLFYN